MSDVADDPVALAEAERILAPRAWPVTLKLSVPVQFGKSTIDELVFQRGTFGTLKGINTAGTLSFDEVMLVASRLTAQPLKMLEMLDTDDVSEVVEIVIGFFGRCRGAGKKLSQP